MMQINQNAISERGMRMRTLTSAFKIGSIALSASLALSAIASANPVTVKPVRTTLSASDYGSNAYFINGSVLPNAFIALDAVESNKGKSADNGWLMTLSNDGQFFSAGPSQNNPNAVTLHVAGGRAVLVSSTLMPPVAATLDFATLRAIRAAYGFFQTQTGLPPGGSRSLADYDVLVHPYKTDKYHVRYAGRLFVWLLHHRDLNVRNTFAGCFDGAGYDEQYVVDPGTLDVIALPCK